MTGTIRLLILTSIALIDRILIEFNHVQLANILIIETATQTSKYMSSNGLQEISHLWSTYILTFIIENMEGLLNQIGPLLLHFSACRKYLEEMNENSLKPFSEKIVLQLMKAIDSIFISFIDNLKFQMKFSSVEFPFLEKALSKTHYQSLYQKLFDQRDLAENFHIEPEKFLIIQNIEAKEPRQVIDALVLNLGNIMREDSNTFIIEAICAHSIYRSNNFFDSYAAYWLNPLLLEVPPIHSKTPHPKSKKKWSQPNIVHDIQCEPELPILLHTRKSLDFLIKTRRTDLKLFELLSKHLWIWELFFSDFKWKLQEIGKLESEYMPPFIDFFNRLMIPMMDFFKRKASLSPKSDTTRIACVSNLLQCLGMMGLISLKLQLTAMFLKRIRGKDIFSIIQMCRDSMFGHSLPDQDRRLNLIWKSNILMYDDAELQYFYENQK